MNSSTKLPILLLAIILVILPAVPAGLLNIDKQDYALGDVVSIVLDPSALTGYSLQIANDKKIYSYAGQMPSIVKFQTQEEGLHEARLKFDSNGTVAESQRFIVGVQQPKKPEAIIQTDRNDYNLGQTVTITIQGDITGASLVIIKDERRFQYLGALKQTIEYLPRETGVYTIEVSSALGTYSATFTVSEINLKFEEPVLTINSLGIKKVPEFTLFKQGIEILPEQVRPGTRLRARITPGAMTLDMQNLAYTPGISVRYEDIPGPSVKQVDQMRTSVKAYAIDPTNLDFEYAEVSGIAVGTELWKCAQYDFNSRTCSGPYTKVLDLIPGEPYAFILTPEDPLFSETRTDVSCSCQDTQTNPKSGTVDATCTVFCPVTIDVPASAISGFLRNMSYSVSISLTGSCAGDVPSGTHTGYFDHDQTVAGNNRAFIGSSTATSSTTPTWTNASLAKSGSSAFDDVSCDDWSNSCTWYVYITTRATCDPPGSSQKTLTANISLSSMRYTWNYTTPGSFSVVLNSPINDFVESSSPVTFDYTPADATYTITNCTLYTNKSGSWAPGSSSTSIDNNMSNYLDETFSSDGQYLWNVRCENSNSDIAWSLVNKTFILDTTGPTVLLESPANNNFTTDSVITFEYNVSDLTAIENCSLIIDGSIENTETSITKDTTQQFVQALSNGVHNWSVQCYDEAFHLGTSSPRTINVSVARIIWTDTWYETSGSNCPGACSISLDNATDGTPNTRAITVPGSTLMNLLNATSPYIGGNGAFIASGTTVTFRSAFSGTNTNLYITWKLYILHADDSLTSICSYGNDGTGGKGVTSITSDTCTPGSNHRLLGSDRLRLVMNVWNSHPSQDRSITHTWDSADSYVNINNFISLGDLSVELVNPTSNITIGQGETYNHKCRATCTDGTCLSTTVTAQYNTSSTAWATISSSENLKLGTGASNPYSIGNLVGSQNGTILVNGSVASTNNIRCLATSTYDSAIGPQLWTVTVGDSVAPSVSLLTPADGDSTNNGTIRFRYTVSDASGLTSCALLINGSINQTDPSPTNPGTNSFVANDIAEGFFLWTVNCTDTGGLVGTDTPHNLIVDRTAPTLTPYYPEPDDVIAYDTITFNWTVTDAVSSSLLCDLYVDGSLNKSDVTSQSGQVTNWTVGGFSVSSHTYYVNCTDDALNYNASSVRTFNVTDTAPSVNLIWPSTGYTNPLTSINLTYYPTDNNGLSNCTLILDGANNLTEPVINNSENNIFALTGLQEKLYNWTVRCVDTGGLNATAAPVRTFIIDASPPNTESISPQDTANVSNADVTFIWNVTDNLDPSLICNLTLDTSRLVSKAVSNGAQGSHPQPNVPDGVHAWNVTCQDNGGLTDTSTTRTLNVSEYPTIALTLPAPNAYIKENYTFTYIPSDNDGFASCSSYLDNVFNASSAAISNGASNNFPVLLLSEGAHKWNVTCTDNGTYSNQKWSLTRSFTVDSQAPNTTALYPLEGNRINTSSVPFNWTVTDNYDTLLTCTLYIDGSQNQTGIPSQAGNITTVSKSFSNGIHNWSVTCLDDALNSNSTATIMFNVTVPPTVLLTNPPPNTFDKYIEQALEYTPHGNSPLDSCVLVINGVDNSTEPAPSPDVTNTFVVNLTNEGTYNWTVRCNDTGGLSTTATQRNITIDFGLPGIDTHSPSQDEVLDTNLVTYNWTVSDYYSPNATCTVYVNETPRVFNINATIGIPKTAPDQLPDGNYGYYVNCTDTAGNNNVSITKNFSIVAPPKITLLIPGNQSYSSNTSYNVTYIPTDGGYVIPSCQLILNGVPGAIDNSPDEGITNIFPIGPLSDGAHNWTVSCTDQDSNVGTADPFYFTVDTTAPGVFPLLPGVDDALISSAVLFNWTVTDNLDTSLLCNLTVDGSLNKSSLPVNNGSYRNETVLGFGDGDHNWQVSCWDDAYKTNTTALRNFSVQEPPSIALALPANLTRTKNVTVAFYFTPFDNSGTIDSCELLIDGVSNNTVTPVTEGSQKRINGTGMNDGTYLWTINCTDPSGNEGTNSSPRIIYIDQLGPAINLTVPQNDTTFNGNNITFNWTPVDFNNTLVNCNITATDSPTDQTTSRSGLSNVSQGVRFNNMADGLHYWNVTCADDLGNINTSITYSFIINQPDLLVNDSSIIFNNTNPDINNSLTISATVWNIGGNDATNLLVSFWDGYPGLGTLIGNDTINVTYNSSNTASVTWNISAGYHTIWVVADPNEVIGELNESNNNASANISVLSSIITSPPTLTFTNDNTPLINFTLADDTGGSISWSIRVDGSPNGQSGTETDGTAHLLNLSTLSDGNRSIVVRATDGLGRIKDSTPVIIRVDTTAPYPYFNTGNKTYFNTPTPNINFTITDAQDSLLNWTLYLDGASHRNGTAINGSWTNTTIGSLVNGTYVLLLEAWDEAGNYVNSTPITIYVDQIAPNVTLFYPSDFANITGTRSTQLNYTVTDNLDPILLCNLTLDASIVDTYNVTNGSIRSYTATNLIEGIHAWNATCFDEAGNNNVSDTRTFGIYIAPTISLLSPPDITVTNNSTVLFTFNASDETGLQNCSILFDGQINDTKTSAELTNNGVSNFTVYFSQGRQLSWAIQCYDSSIFQMYAINGTRNLTVDMLAPYPVFETQNQSWFNTATPTIYFNITDDFDQTLNYTIFVDGSPDIEGSVSNDFSTSETLSALTNGTHLVIIEAFDDAGNYRNSSTLTIYVDTVAPNVTLLYPENNANLTTRTTELNFTVTDAMSDPMTCNLTLDGSVIRTNFTVNNDSTSNKTVTGLSSGAHYWNATCIDLAGNKRQSSTWTFNVESPDLIVLNVTFSDNLPIEGQSITVFANVSNMGKLDTSNITVQFFSGYPESGGSQILPNRTIDDLNVTDSIIVNVTYTTHIGTNLIVVRVDPPIASNGTILESNESNNEYNATLQVGHYEIVAGQANSQLEVADALYGDLFTWNVSNSTGSNIFVADTDSSPDFLSLKALGRDTSDTYHLDDFADLDTQLNSSSFMDSINKTWTSSGLPIFTQSFAVFGTTLSDVPTVNSTNTTNFRTGILWDTSDGGVEYNGTQDVIFITQMNEEQTGGYGTYDYELKVPATLRDYTGGTSTVSFYTEIK
ncbi:MAG: CARDB domain-containing protein [Candidatus Woesearchaeota archaeon]